MPYGLTSIRVGSEIVPVRNFGKATHLVVGLKSKEIIDDIVEYVALDSENDLRNPIVVSNAEYIDEVIFCSEKDWWRAKYDFIKKTQNFNL